MWANAPAYPHARMFLKPILPAPPNLDRYGRSGQRLSRSEEGTMVTDVGSASPAALAGARASDLVVTVDGRPAAERTIDEIRSLLRGQPPKTGGGLVRSGVARRPRSPWCHGRLSETHSCALPHEPEQAAVFGNTKVASERLLLGLRWKRLICSCPPGCDMLAGIGKMKRR
jgi:hypothetical protein